MRLQNREHLAYFSALSLFFSCIEMIFPRFVPFFRLGLGNIALLMALELPFGSFILLALVKASASALTGGTLFSPFFLISLAQTVLSAGLMRSLFVLAQKSNRLSVYGISALGSAASALAQILLCALYLGLGTLALFGPMLIFNTLSGIITAFLCVQFSCGKFSAFLPAFSQISAQSPADSDSGGFQNPAENPKARKKLRGVLKIVFLICVLSLAVSVFFIRNIAFLIAAVIVGFAAQKISGRKIMLLPHISIWIFVLMTALFMPEGKVLCRIWGISVTHGAILTAVTKALRLSAVSALSQCAVMIPPPRNSVLALTLGYYKKMSDHLRRIRTTR